MTDRVRVGINGFGRIGRTVCRAAWRRPDAEIEVVAANDIQPADQVAYLLEHDSIAGRWPDEVTLVDGALDVGGRRMLLLNEPEPAQLPWSELGIDVVIESSRRYTAAEQARRHLAAGAPLVIVSAPSTGADATFVVGVNDHTFDPAQHRVVSNGSCTTNCLAPMAQVLDNAFGIEDGLLTTVHAYTSDQALVDGAGGRGRDSRAAALNIIPTTTGAARAIGAVLPHLDGRLRGGALRVPVADGSLIDLTVTLREPASVDEVNSAFHVAAGDVLAGILAYSDRPIVSTDIIGTTASCTFDAPLTVTSGAMTKVFAWYDNEWGYANRLVDLASRLGQRLKASVVSDHPPRARS